MKIINIESSNLKTKRFKIELDNNKKYNFGLKGGSTYLDHKDKIKRENYRRRHLGNPKEKQLIEGLTPSPALFSYYILWGDSTNINTNIRTLNKLFKKVH